MRTKAEFRAIRETVGMTQAALADELGVQERSVKRWEGKDAPQVPPEDAWDVLGAALDRQREVVLFALSKVYEISDEMGDEPIHVSLPYWSCAEDYEASFTDAANGIHGDWRMANANARVLAAILWAEGVEVEWSGKPIVTVVES